MPFEINDNTSCSLGVRECMRLRDSGFDCSRKVFGKLRAMVLGRIPSSKAVTVAVVLSVTIKPDIISSFS